MSVLSRAVQQQQRELAAYCLLIAMSRLADRVPQEGLAELVRLLEEGDAGLKNRGEVDRELGESGVDGGA